MVQDNGHRYTTYCETFHQIPVIQVSDLDVTVSDKPRPFYIKIETLAACKDDNPYDAEAYVYWRNDQPPCGSLLMGIMTIGINDQGMVFYFERIDVEVRPGDVHDVQYRPRHFSHVPVHVRAFGKVVQKEVDAMTIEVETYIGTGKSRFRVRFNVPDHHAGQLPAVGTFAGGSGDLQGVTVANEDGLSTMAYLSINMVDLHLGTMRSSSVRNEAGKQDWLQSYNKSGPSTTKTIAKPKASASSTINSSTTFCDVYHRFMIVDVIDTSSRLTIVRTAATNRHMYDFEMVWPSTEIPPPRTVFGMIARMSVKDGSNVIVPVPSSIDVRPGNVADVSYRDHQLLSGPCRARVAGKVVSSTKAEFTLIGMIAMNNAELPFQVRFLVPSTARWDKFKGVPVGQFVSGRGTLSGITDGSNATVIIDLDHLANPPIGQSDASTSVSTETRPPLSAWDAPATKQRNSMLLPAPPGSWNPSPDGITSASVVPDMTISSASQGPFDPTVSLLGTSGSQGSSVPTTASPTATFTGQGAPGSPPNWREKGKQRAYDVTDGGRPSKKSRP
ncbi:hypothetical protein CF319_g6842 [Tilletia indica]|nr:hypothetical protein CF319_g6842 [Tilletia indica]